MSSHIGSEAMEAQGFERDETGVFCIPEDGRLLMRIPSDLIPKCPDAVYACLNYNEAYAPKQIAAQSVCISGDTGEVLEELAASL